jgi:hypothetical protein
MRWCVFALAAAIQAAFAQEPAADAKLAQVRRVYVDQLTGGDTAAQMRDLLIASLHNTHLFVVTENAERADAILRGAAEDLIYTEAFASSDGVDLRAAAGAVRSTRSSGIGNRALSVGVSDDESLSIRERKHEALAAVRLVNREGDVIWSTTQESTGAKFRGASADVAEKVTRQLAEDYRRVFRDGAQASGPAPSRSGAGAETH